MVRSTVFKTNRTQAVRLPKSVALPDTVREVEITRSGNSLVISPAGQGWQEFFATHRLGDDFPADREQPADQDRIGF